MLVRVDNSQAPGIVPGAVQIAAVAAGEETAWATEAYRPAPVPRAAL
jgi:hypothetical protein